MATGAEGAGRPLKIGVLALQGAFREHADMLRALGADVSEVRKTAHLTGLHGLVIPGGESTVMGKLAEEWDLLEAIRRKYAEGMAIFGTCAGLILLCERIEGYDQPRLGLLHATVRRNAFGRQVDSFEAPLALTELLPGDRNPTPFPAVFIRAPVITELGPTVRVLARVQTPDGESRAVAVVQDRLLGISFHPELTGDTRLHEAFLRMIPRE